MSFPMMPLGETNRVVYDEALKALQRLIVVCQDGVEGYRHAAQAVKDPVIHRVLATSSAQREEVVSVLSYALVQLGDKPNHHHGSVEGAFHRAWLDVEKLAHVTPKTIVHECQRGEHATIEEFANVLSLDLPTDVRSTVQSQLGRLLEASEALSRIA